MSDIETVGSDPKVEESAYKAGPALWAMAMAKAKAKIEAEVKAMDEDEAALQLIQRSSVSLAALYKEGKARGLLTSRVQYH